MSNILQDFCPNAQIFLKAHSEFISFLVVLVILIVLYIRKLIPLQDHYDELGQEYDVLRDRYLSERHDLKINANRIELKLSAAEDRIREFEWERGNRRLPLGKAVEYILEDDKCGKQKIGKQIIDNILDLAAGSSMTILGRHKMKILDQSQPEDSKVLEDFLADCWYFPRYGVAGAPALIRGKRDDERRDVEAYFDPTVSIEDIEHHFDIRIDSYVPW